MDFNFNSQICTTREQSERLLSLGLKKETADMAYRTIGKVVDMGEVRWMYQHNPSVVYKGIMTEEDIPAWSLHRIMSLINSENWNTEITLNDGRYIIYYGYNIKMTEDPYDVLIDAIEYQITVGVFNKEYLV